MVKKFTKPLQLIKPICITLQPMKNITLSTLILCGSALLLLSQSNVKGSSWVDPGSPKIMQDGKLVPVTADAFIEHHLKGAKSKYKLIGVPDG